MASGSEIGGYDYSLVDEAQTPRYSCTICTKIFKDPHLTACCGQHFCASCMQRWLESQSTCPNCREGLFQHFLDKKFVREINSLKVKCPNNKDGCTCELELGSLKQHLENGCDYALAHCLKCYRSVVRKDLNNHLESKCPCRSYQCQYCGKTGQYRNHGNNCKERPIACPNECGEKDIKQKDMYDHRRECPLEPVECPFNESGCKKKVPRQDLTNHVKSSIEDHLLLTAQTCNKLKRSNKALTSFVEVMLEGCRPAQRKALESVRSFFDESYHLGKDDATEDIYLTAHYTRNDTDTGAYIFVTPSFYLLDGYKVEFEIKIRRGVDEEPPFIIECELYLDCGEYDDELKWPLCNDYEMSVHMNRYFRGENPISSTEGNSQNTFSITKPVPMCSECSQTSFDCEGPIMFTRDKIVQTEARKLISERSSGIDVTLTLSHHNHAKKRKLSTQED